MINPIVIFILGMASGGFVIYFFVSAYWTKRLQTARQALLNQYDSDLNKAQQRCQTLETAAQQWLREKARLGQEVEQEKRDRTQLQADYDAYRLEAKAQITEQAEKGVNLAIEQSKEIEAEKQALQQKLQQEIEQLERNLNSSVIETQQIKQKSAQEKSQLEAELQSAYESAGITFASIAQALFKNIEIQRDSAIEIDKNQECAHAILLALRAIDGKNFRASKPLNETGKVWFESEEPGLKMMRIYFRKNKPDRGKCEVLISHKKDSKTQSKDIKWMKKHAS